MSQQKDILTLELVKIIDPDEPPGMAAMILARSVLDLIEDRDGKEALILQLEIIRLAQLHPRSYTR